MAGRPSPLNATTLGSLGRTALTDTLTAWTAPRSTLQTERTVLRRWTSDDRESFAEMNSDPEVMEYFPAVLTREDSDRLADTVDEHFALYGFGPWALEIPNVARFAGFVGLSVPRFVASFTPCVEIGWRLARAFWGHGYVTEAARAALAFGFDELRLNEIVSFTVPTNFRSRRVMERLGMTHDDREDFEHPSLPEKHPLRRHVLYRKRGKALPNQALQSDDHLGRSAPSGGRR